MTDIEAKKLGVCMRCRRSPVLVRRRDNSGWRSLQWCVPCERPAHGGASFVQVDHALLMKLPIIENADRQEKLL